MSDENQARGDKIVMYGTPVCPMVRPCRGVLNRAGAAFDYVDILHDQEGRATVRDINNGNESVPTLVFPDGTTLTEPSLPMLKEKLEGMGHSLRRPKPWELATERPMLLVMSAFALLFGFNDANNVFLLIGVALLAFIFIGGWLRG